VIVSNVNPRAGRSGNLLFALFAFVVYYNLLNFSQSWIAAGRTGFFTLFVLLHGGTFLAAALWLAKQHNNWGLAPLLRRLHRKTA
jgi:lipopolysaccharide export system permease protein